ncbi:hypothetical protein MesoLjLc_71050 [Mesorhizobium sp. L-8-10]|nr:hypothetical protein MesoLjLb_70140 [Mesorhizobium sp. L-8-3]BCH35175.1 hypothetical protein MesoLjLc_71050 [Mesorhizobium sp. L-8-10]
MKSNAWLGPGRVHGPLGMEATTFDPPADIKDRLMQAHDFDGSPAAVSPRDGCGYRKKKQRSIWSATTRIHFQHRGDRRSVGTMPSR